MMAMLRMFCIKTFSFCRAGASPAETGHGNRSGRPTTNEERGICSRTRENQQLPAEDNGVGGPRDDNARSAFGSSFLISDGHKLNGPAFLPARLFNFSRFKVTASVLTEAAPPRPRLPCCRASQ